MSDDSSESSGEIMAPHLEDVLEGLDLRLPREPNANPEQSVGTLCQVKTLYEGRKKCGCCINWVEQYPEDTKDPAEETSAVKRYAILTRMQKAHGKVSGSLELHSIAIQSPLLKSVLKNVFAGYPGITTTLSKVEFQAPFWEFFYRWQDLEDAQNTNESEVLDQVHLLLTELTHQLGNVHRIAKDLVQNNVMEHAFLWTLFPPGALAYYRHDDQDYLLQVEKTEYDRNKNYNLQCRYIEWNGDKFGWKQKRILITQFSGTRSIQDLEAYPVTYHKASRDIQVQLAERGQKFVSLRPWQHKAYRGIMRVLEQHFCSSYKLDVDERIIVDAKAFFQHTSSSMYLVGLDEQEIGSQPSGELPDRLLMLCSPEVKAYALKSKCWGVVYPNGISDIKWSENAFEKLVLERETKRLIESFVSAQIRQNDSPSFDDIIEGKGQGMILLLTGEPGIGKTLTAETVAEKAHRPLYMLSAGELGTASEKVEEGLTKILALAYRWRAILLLDESDVFLEQRTSDNLKRNQLVSIFLRMLEYYRGILFLTTNRVSAFDTAFQSRIHLTLQYPPLDQVSRRQVWQLLLELAHASSGISEEHLDALAKHPLNGRQIKNAVKSAKLLAMADDVALGVEHINIVLRVMSRSQSSGASSPYQTRTCSVQ
ncbi:P-loop containing nucleoside triphosphate hydrolase protein [Xylaria arbuscula]|nr:P-loop containing nucleoside triphosphate hydrolase protein [Xylaria arbuscula]